MGVKLHVNPGWIKQHANCGLLPSAGPANNDALVGKSKGTAVTRNADRLEILARDLASRYGEDDHLVRDIRPGADSKSAPADTVCRTWRVSQRHTFKHARLAKLGVGIGAA
jgi:hypothetical protein